MAMTPCVVDLFRGDKVTDWTRVRAAGIQGCIHKASEGSAYRDNAYEERRKEAADAGLLWGAYHFGDSSDVEAQVENFLEAAGSVDGLLLALDFEENPKGQGRTMRVDQARRFLSLLMEKTGRTPDQLYIYGGNVLKEKIIAQDDLNFFGQFRLWLCQYGPKANVPRAWSKYTLWQYTGDGTGMGPHEVDGISTKGIDLNVFGGADLVAEWAPRANSHVVASMSITSPQPTTATREGMKSTTVWTLLSAGGLKLIDSFTDWLNSAWNTVMWVLGLLPDVTGEVQGQADSAEQISSWLHFNKDTAGAIVTAVVIVAIIVAVVRHSHDKKELASNAQ